MVGNKVLIIEGTSDTRNGILRQGFNKLLVQKLKGQMPKIIMGDGKKQAIDKFLHHPDNREPFLLVDLDRNESHKNDDLKENNLEDKSDKVHFMVQEMEAWFLSQPEVLEKFYSANFLGKIPGIHAKEINKPSDFLYELTKQTKRGKYHKVKHAVDILPQLDATKLMEDFDDFKQLVSALKN